MPFARNYILIMEFLKEGGDPDDYRIHRNGTYIPTCNGDDVNGKKLIVPERRKYVQETVDQNKTLEGKKEG